MHVNSAGEAMGEMLFGIAGLSRQDWEEAGAFR